MLGAVLVGGRSRRMGRAKSLIEIGGVPMARRVGDVLAEAGCSRVVAVGPGELRAGLDHIEDLHPGEGPLGGILTALHAAASGPALVVACDLPWLDAPSLAELLAAAGRGEDVVVARTRRIEPLCALWQPGAMVGLQTAFDAGERAMHVALERLVVTEVTLGDSVLINVNTPDDLPSE